MSQYRSKIKSSLQIITQSIKQIPQDKQPLIASRVNKVLQKYANQQSEQSLKNFNKELEFNLNFVKLSYPNINFNLQQRPEQQQPFQQTINKQQSKQNQLQKQLFQLQNAKELKKEMKDISGVREQVKFSNWVEGNVDPQDLRRHKQLLSRQYYGGDFWKGKQKPRSQTADFVARIINNPDIQPPKVTQKDLEKKERKFQTDPSTAWQKIKR